MIELSKKERGRILSKVTIDFKDPEKGCWNYNTAGTCNAGKDWNGKNAALVAIEMAQLLKKL